MTDWMIHPEARIGHVNLNVADLERAIAFYHGALGFTVTQRQGNEAAFLAAGDYHHHLALNTWESKDSQPPAPGQIGLHHLAIVYPDRRELAQALQRLLDRDVPIWGALDHGATEAVYLRDPDGNGLELYWDRPREEWPVIDGRLAMDSRPLDLRAILAELDVEPEAVDAIAITA